MELALLFSLSAVAERSKNESVQRLLVEWVVDSKARGEFVSNPPRNLLPHGSTPIKARWNEGRRDVLVGVVTLLLHILYCATPPGWSSHSASPLS